MYLLNKNGITNWQAIVQIEKELQSGAFKI
jgi:hypothetical protein